MVPTLWKAVKDDSVKAAIRLIQQHLVCGQCFPNCYTDGISQTQETRQESSVSESPETLDQDLSGHLLLLGTSCAQ